MLDKIKQLFDLITCADPPGVFDQPEKDAHQNAVPPSSRYLDAIFQKLGQLDGK